MKIKYCPICKSKLILHINYEGEGIDQLYCTRDLYVNTFHFEASVEKIIYRTNDFRFTLSKSNKEFYISYFLNGKFRVFEELNESFYIYFDKALEILENDLGSFRLKMLIKKFDNLLIFQ